jgi:hypothetical protein
MKKFEEYTRRSIFAKLREFCLFADEDSYIEVTQWKNGEGFDVEISSVHTRTFQFTYGEFLALKKIVKQLEPD